jgi:hypothetical protein
MDTRAESTSISNAVYLNKKKLFLLRGAVAAAILGLSGYAITAQASVIQQTAPQVLLVTESDNSSGTQTAASIGPLAGLQGQVSQISTGGEVQNSSSYLLVPHNGSLDTTYQNNAAAQNAVNNYLQNYISTIATQMASRMRANGSGMQFGIFTYSQTVQIQNPNGGSPTQATVYGSVTVYPNSSGGAPKYQYLGTNINNDTLYVLYASYQQSQSADYLPAGYTAPFAGDTTWELLSVTSSGGTVTSTEVPVSGQSYVNPPQYNFYVINDNGAYDAPSQTVNGTQTVEYGVGAADWIHQQVVPMMKQYNASYAFAQYGKQVTVARNASGGPIMAMSVNSRTISSTCGGPATLNNTGVYGYLLNEANNIYTVQPTDTYSLADQTSTILLSPTSSFNVSANVGNNAKASNYINDIVFPVAPYAGSVVDYTSGSPLPESDYTYVAPLTNNLNGGGGSSTINSSAGQINVCVAPQEYQWNSPTWWTCYGSTKNGCDWNPVYNQINWQQLFINNNVDQQIPYNSGNYGHNVSGYYGYSVQLAWNPGYYVSWIGQTGMISGGTDQYTIDEWNGQYISNGVYFYGFAWSPGPPPAVSPSVYTISAAQGGYYNCATSGCTYSPPVWSSTYK